MIFLMLLFTIKITCSSYTGSSIFYKRSAESDCWSENDIARLRARQIYEQIIPPQVLPDKINDNYIKHILKYFQHALKTAAISNDGEKSISSKDLLADTIASHMRSETLPASRFAYYAGYVSNKRVRELHDFYNSLKIILNTQGLGWKPPEKVPKWRNLTMEKIKIGIGKYADPCSLLITKRDAKSCIHLPPPKLDQTRSDQKPSAMALPFRTGGLVNLESAKSNNVLLKYYTTASRCILRKSPAKCRHSDFISFNNELWHWMKRDVAPHLADEKLYTAFGGVLRIAAAVQSYGKGLSKRNPFEYENVSISKWRPWKKIPNYFIGVDESPYLYLLFILLVLVAICLLQICFNYIFKDGDQLCQNKTPSSLGVRYACVDTNIPAMLPSHRCEIREPLTKSETSIVSPKTQKVHDMHENKENTMSVIINDSEDGESSKSSLLSHDRSELEKHDPVGNKKKKNNERSRSPPKIETSISEIKVGEKRPTKLMTAPQKTLYSTTCTVTDSARTFPRDDSTSSSASSSSGQTTRSTSSKTSRRHSRLSRDLSWAHRVASKQTQLRSTSGTEYKSFTTPP